MLNIVEVALEKNGFKFARLDGTLSQPKRCKALKDFENVADVRVMLLSLRAGGLGLTLTCANVTTRGEKRRREELRGRES